jgi:GR25 family glycosyltransferase involved in LPS biosynthesis
MEKKIKKTILKDYKYFIAVDCNTDLFKYEFKVITDWIDPISKNKINIGSIACTLSHYYVWKYIVDNNIEKCLILEDDTVFYDNFNEEFEKILKLPQQYDLLYLNRNALYSIYGLGKELEINGNIVIPKYSYNTNAYIISYDGAQKLLNTDLLNNILPVDEFLSIMYDNSYPFTQYSNYFENTIKLKALALKNDITNQEPRTIFSSAIEQSAYYIENT